jgi:hypothetical protein
VSRGAASLEFLSRGDRVRARLAHAEGSDRPLVLLGAADGDGASPFAAAALEAWSPWASVCALDLPLCGARSSDKLTPAAFEAGTPLAERLRPDLEAQLASDCTRALDALRERFALTPGGVAYAGIARGALLAGELAEREPRIDAVVLVGVDGTARVASHDAPAREEKLPIPGDAALVSALGALLRAELRAS